jgi:hypothetical protein
MSRKSPETPLLLQNLKRHPAVAHPEWEKPGREVVYQVFSGVVGIAGRKR